MQRVLSAHAGIATTAEPWIMLPLATTLAGGDRQTAQAIGEFRERLRGGSAAYAEELRTFVLNVYERAARDGDTYFLDKTPNYHLVVEEILTLFPEAKAIFLWRNPLSVVASNLETFGVTRGDGHQRWDPYRFRVDLFDGPANLVSACRRHSTTTHGVRYEDLVSGDAVHWNRLLGYLGMEFDPGALTRFAEIELVGRYQDPTGVDRYRMLSQQPQAKWRGTFRTPLRRAWGHRYIDWLGPERLGVMGYAPDRLHAELNSAPTSFRGTGRDLADVARSRLWRWSTTPARRTFASEAWRALLGGPRS